MNHRIRTKTILLVIFHPCKQTNQYYEPKQKKQGKQCKNYHREEKRRNNNKKYNHKIKR
jgi:hypothetical protein